VVGPLTSPDPIEGFEISFTHFIPTFFIPSQNQEVENFKISHADECSM
jgi:hypothetical protein